MKDALEDLPLRRRLEQGWPHHDFTAVHLVEHLRAFLAGQRAAVDGIDEGLAAGRRRVLHQEMAGHASPTHRQAGPLPYRHVEHRERDRDADPAIEHFVEKAVAWVVVFLAIALEVQLVE